ncbi:MAG: alpha/beta fold hydrolase, partial [Myxococcota bacterium]
MQVERVEAALGAIYGPRRWLVASDVLQGAVATVRRLREFGSSRCFVIAAREGTGAAPSPDDCEWRVLGLPPLPMMEAIHASEAALRALPDEVQAAVDAFDPHHTLEVIGAIFSDGRPVAGRRFFGARPAAWRALEDKTVVDGVWDAAGVPRAPSEVVDVALAPLTAAAARLDRGHGSVWAGDARAGFHGGATYTCWVRSDRDAVRAHEHLAARCATARVMPFLEGIPCSVHGVVFPGHTVVLRPAELVTLRRAGSRTGFLYARAGTFWDPPPAGREAMRTAARRVGEHLRATLAYRGAFTLDGVMTADGFLPTELNPRVGAALGMMVPAFPFSFLHDALVEGIDGEWDPVALEAELLATADAARSGSLGFVTDRPFPETIRRPGVGRRSVARGGGRRAAGRHVDGRPRPERRVRPPRPVGEPHPDRRVDRPAGRGAGRLHRPRARHRGRTGRARAGPAVSAVRVTPAPGLPPWLEAAMPFRRVTVELDGRRFHAVDHGEGPAVVLVHGNPTWSFLWRKVIRRLTGFRVIAPDLAGFGLSHKPRRVSAHTVDGHVADLVGIVAALGVEEAVVVGQDWGGPLGCGLAAALDRGGHLRGMVLANTAVLPARRPVRATAFHRFAHLPAASELAFVGLGFPLQVLGYTQQDPTSIGRLERDGYRYPFRRLRDRVGPLALARMVPHRDGHPSLPALDRIGA